MAAFVPTCTPAPWQVRPCASRVHVTQSLFARRAWHLRKRKRCAPHTFSMNADKPAAGEPEKTEAQQKEDEEERLQKDASYVFREFGKISAVACLIGLVLFFYDILVSLLAISVGLLYALAVLFEVRGADMLVSNILKSAMRLWNAGAKGVRDGWRAIRREVRKGLED